MIVHCDKCSAKFRLDDAKVKEGGVKVRCSKCSNIFIVQKEAPAEEPDFDTFLSSLMPSPQESAPGGGGNAPAAATSIAKEEPEAEKGETAEPPAAEDQISSKEASDQEDFGLNEFAFDDQAFNQEPMSVVADGKSEATGDGFVFGEFDLGGTLSEEVKPETREEGAEEGARDEISFDSVPARALPEVDVNIDGLELFEGAGSAGLVPDKEEVPVGAGPGEFSFEIGPVGPNVSEVDTDIFTDSTTVFSFEPDASESAHSAVRSGQEEGVEQPKERTVFDQISADTLVGSHEFEEGLPPLSISSRRKGGSSLPITVTAVCILLVLILGGGGFYFFKEGPVAFDKLGLGFMAKWFGAESKEEGSIAVKNATGMFLVNKEVGEVFAVTGEAVNNFGKPRASVQVKVTLFGPKGAPLAQKTAYCGNSLSRDQMVSLPLEKLEAAMSNQFGDSLSNLAVLPGKSIPFIVVLTNVPKETVEFGVEVVGSTVASQ